jgi:ParB family chromosome partitioning protein
MKQQQQRLGRGLGALIGVESGADRNAVLEIDVNELDTNLQQPRKRFDEEKLAELAQSIRTYGIVQPIIVQRSGERYTIIAGERRYRAARLAGLTEVPVVVKEYSEQEFMEVSLVENLQREDLNPIEEAQAMRLLMEEHDLTQDELSVRLGKSRSAVANTLRLLSLPDEVRELVVSGELSGGHARCLVAMKSDHDKIMLARRIVAQGLSVRAAEALAAAAAEKKAEQRAKKSAAPEIEQAQGALTAALGTRVEIVGDLRRGKIVLSYYNPDQLQSLYDFLMTSK